MEFYSFIHFVASGFNTFNDTLNRLSFSLAESDKKNYSFSSRFLSFFIRKNSRKLGKAGWENVWLSIIAYIPRCPRSIHLKSNIFSSGLTILSIST